MASEKQIAANRRNAQKSTGPKSPEGKKKVSQNRTKHGFTARQHAILPGEDESACESLRATLTREWEPESEAEAFQVELMAMHQWRILRAARMERDAFLRFMQECPGSTRLSGNVEDLSRYEARSTRAYFRALETLRHLQANPHAPVLDPEPDSAQQPSAAATAESVTAPVAEAPSQPGSSNPVSHLHPNQPIGHSKPIPPPAALPEERRDGPATADLP